jgi:UDP-N-acetylmuramate dehydrogenase
MVIDKNDLNSKSAGSFFKNPVVHGDTLAVIKGSFDAVPYFPFGEEFKLPAAWLIETSGFAKGYTDGKVGISTNHTLALINRGHATAADVIRLKNKVQNAVFERFGIELEPEPVFVGFQAKNE